jgi:hypothetical protein
VIISFPVPVVALSAGHTVGCDEFLQGSAIASKTSSWMPIIVFSVS